MQVGGLVTSLGYYAKKAKGEKTRLVRGLNWKMNPKKDGGKGTKFNHSKGERKNITGRIFMGSPVP